MINIKDKSKCCGCNACGDICAHKAITFKTDEEGFWYPVVNKDLCTNCRLCERVCPILHADELKNNDLDTPICYAANHKNLEVRFDSTSGGAFTALAEDVYKKGGYVGGAIYNEDWSASHFISADKADLVRLRSSKYLQSDAIGFYRQVKDCCETGKPVLVCGTPCQMGALRRFLRKGYENLLILDFICHSIASPKAHRKYIDYLEEKYGSKVVYFKAKNKEFGWDMLTKHARFSNGQSYWGVKGQDCYSRAYHSNMIDRPSCYECKFKGYPRMSDITVADFWEAGLHKSALNDNIGTSAIIINSKKGEQWFASASKRLLKHEITVNEIEKGNPALVECAKRPNYNREQFFNDLDLMNFGEVADKYFPIKQSRFQTLHLTRAILSTFKSMTQFRPVAMWQFFKLNFFTKSIHTNWRVNALIYPSPYCVFEISGKSNIIIEGPVLVGLKKFRKSKLETRVLVEEGANVHFRGAFRIGYGADIEVFRNAEFVCGANSGGNIALTVICGQKIHIGTHTFYGRNVSIRDTNGGHIIAQQGFKNSNPIIIGDNVWLCSEAKIMPGVKIGDSTIIGSNSMVVSQLPSRVLVSGVPAKIIDTDIYWKH
jgi:acetyltransferase-like isoleucine patch superfamily enzyme/coenzyme F420-reducing hydrogenase beta subunit